MGKTIFWSLAAFLVLAAGLLAHLSGGVSAAEGGASATAAGLESGPPDLKKGARIRFSLVGGSLSRTASVQDVRGKWVQLEDDDSLAWYNSDNFVWYVIVREAGG